MGVPTRGERNNNPFNLKQTDIKWQGKVTPSTDPLFETFVSPLMGLRAGFKNLLNQPKEGNTTIWKIITKYAPPQENNTNQYIKSVCVELKCNADDVLDLDNYHTLYTLGCAILLREQGRIIYSDTMINQAMMLAGVHDAPKPTITSTPECKTILATGSAATIAAIGNATQALSPAIPLVQQMITAAPWIAGVIAAGAIGYLAYRLYLKSKQQVV